MPVQMEVLKIEKEFNFLLKLHLFSHFNLSIKLGFCHTVPLFFVFLHCRLTLRKQWTSDWTGSI